MQNFNLPFLYAKPLFFLVVFLLGIQYSATGQTDLLIQAKDLSYAGKYEEADQLYKSILATDPDNLKARIGNAYNHSWNQNTAQARFEFEQILKKYPDHRDALIGYGYTLAWSEDYANAKYPFLNAMKTAPNDPELIKGLAYVYLWQGSPEVARSMFDKLRTQDESNAEYYIALAYTHLQLFETIKARRLIRQAIALDPANQAAHDVAKALEYATPFFDVDIWGGYSEIASSSRTGLRAVSAGAQISRSFRALFSYDNAMSLDNFFFVDHKLSAETYLAGGIMAWNKYNSSRLQIGYRDLNQQQSQWLTIGEQVLHFRDRKVLKVGGLFAASQDIQNEWMLYTGIGLPVGRSFTIEPVYYLSRNNRAAVAEHRIALNTQWLNKSGFELGLGGHYGKSNTGGAENSLENTFGVYVSAMAPVHRMVWLQANVRHEKGIEGNYLLAAFGVKLRFEK